jgi:hypothetical protein
MPHLKLEIHDLRPFPSDFTDSRVAMLDLAMYSVVLAAEEAFGLEIDLAGIVCLIIPNGALVSKLQDHL